MFDKRFLKHNFLKTIKLFTMLIILFQTNEYECKLLLIYLNFVFLFPQHTISSKKSSKWNKISFNDNLKKHFFFVINK